MESDKNNKVERVLGIYTKLMGGYVVNKAEAAQEYGVNERSIQRDMDDIRNFLELDSTKHGYINSVVYDRDKKGYYLEQISKMKFANSEILALCKILLDSRAFIKAGMENMLDKLIACCVPDCDQKMIYDLIGNEKYHYVELQHHKKFMNYDSAGKEKYYDEELQHHKKFMNHERIGEKEYRDAQMQHHKKFMNHMWDIGQAIQGRNYIEIEYNKKRGAVKRKLKPVAIMFSEYYFYMIAFIEDKEVQEHFDILNDSSPTIYRIDRIKTLNMLKEKFHVPYRDRFEEGEFRKRIQFMYGGKLRKVKFLYSGENVEAVQDRLPTAEILSEEDEKYTMRVEIYGNGIDMWLRSQGDAVKRLD